MKQKGPQWPVMGPSDPIAQGDSSVVYDCLNGLDAKNAKQSTAQGALGDSPDELFKAVKDEVYWQKMSHRTGDVPRLVCAQGDFLEDGAMPIYRHPADEALPLMHWSPLVKDIRDRVQELVGHPMNHCLIQLYRSGNDYISEHSDKTLDIVRGSSIVNVSLGALRTMRLRTKKSGSASGGDGEEGASRRTQLVPMPHGSVFILGQASNMAWLHGINPDKRPALERNEAELAFGGERISLTFRHIGTFLDPRQTMIWGQGACAKSRQDAHAAINGDEAHTEGLIRAFGIENHSSVLDWDGVYGDGFDVLNYTVSKEAEVPLLFLSGVEEVDTRVENLLDSENIDYQVCGVSGEDAGRDYEPWVCFRDADNLHTELRGEANIVAHLTRDI